jgi:hypothetical protein
MASLISKLNTVTTSTIPSSTTGSAVAPAAAALTAASSSSPRANYSDSIRIRNRKSLTPNDGDDEEFYSKSLVKAAVEGDWSCLKLILTNHLNPDLTDEVRLR